MDKLIQKIYFYILENDKMMRTPELEQAMAKLDSAMGLLEMRLGEEYKKILYELDFLQGDVRTLYEMLGFTSGFKAATKLIFKVLNDSR